MVNVSLDKSGFINFDPKVKHSPQLPSSKKRQMQEISMDVSHLTNVMGNLNITDISSFDRVSREDGFYHLHNHQIAKNI